MKIHIAMPGRFGRGPLGPELDGLLRRTSRSFYLSLRWLPRRSRGTIGLAYLLARLADSVVDCPGLPTAARRVWLERFAATIAHRARADAAAAELAPPAGWPPAGVPAAEAALVAAAPRVLAALGRLGAAERRLCAEVLGRITAGMRLDLNRFSATAGVGALADAAELERYCQLVAGCVGRYWTEVHALAQPALQPLDAGLLVAAERYGRGLQLVNVLRDLPADLRRGRCYLPQDELERLDLAPADLLQPAMGPRLQPLVDRLLGETAGLLASGWDYLERLPLGEPRLRLASAWPLLLAGRTLDQLARRTNPLDPAHLCKVPRRQVYLLLVRSLPGALWPAGLTGWGRRELRAVAARYPEVPRELLTH